MRLFSQALFINVTHSTDNIMPYTLGINKSLKLPDDFSSILEQEFWVINNVNAEMLRTFSGPAKFATFTSIFVKRGHCRADIDLISHELEGPCIVNIQSSRILQPTFISEDFDASFVVMSNRIAENIFGFIKDNPVYSLVRRYPVVKVPNDMIKDLERIYEVFNSLLYSTGNPNSDKAFMHLALAYFFSKGYKIYESIKTIYPTTLGWLTDRFIDLVQQNFKKERGLEFYADKLGISPRHLSRSVKKETGHTAVKWIERFVVLEAKALLKSSNLNVQQIADELNFPSQSFFGKYFKKFVGKSPTEFRNS